MDAFLAALAALKGALDVANLAQSLIAQHSQGTTITDEQAQSLRDAVKKAQVDAEAAWASA